MMWYQYQRRQNKDAICDDWGFVGCGFNNNRLKKDKKNNGLSVNFYL